MDAQRSLLQTPRRHSRWRIAGFAAAQRLAQVCGGRAWYRWRHLHPKRWVLRLETLWVPDWPARLEGLRVLQLSDFHAGPFLRGEALTPLVAATERQAPDLIALTGDFITDDWRDVQSIAPTLGALRSRYGSWAVFGNHDYRGRQEGTLAATLREAGIRVLLDATEPVADLPLWVTGLHDLEERRAGSLIDAQGEHDSEEATLRARLAALRSQQSAGSWELALCHHPIGAAALARPQTFAILAGHTHGRQMDLPGLRRLGPDHPGLQVRQFLDGEPASMLYVHRGVGVVGLPVRSRAPAEVLLLEVRRGPQARSASRFETLARWDALGSAGSRPPHAPLRETNRFGG